MITRARCVALIVIAIACAGPVGVRSAADGSRWIDDGDLFSIGFGTVAFLGRDGHSLQARTFRSSGFDPATGPVWFVMHGTDRDADRYIEAAAPVAERHDALAIVIHFDEGSYPRAEDYTLGVYAAEDHWRDPKDMLYAEVERVFDLVRGSLRGVQRGYYIFGHSAGAQFTHRLLTFLPGHRALVAVAANAGWYTLPTADDPRVHSMPYGLVNSPLDPADMVGLLKTPLVVLLSENDTTTAATDDLVRGTVAAEAQGRNRLERGRHYYAVGEARARALGVDFAWGAAGDTNGDGVRDPDQYEFVEITNQGSRPVCLEGWTLSDASADRHVFPIGGSLEPGQVVVVFGGGVPTGPFAGARVERAAGGLSLQNVGDLLTLRDAGGRIVDEASWGDCAEKTCATRHWSGDLDIAASLVRAASPSVSWAVHEATTGARFSPGVLQ
jgi:hypothetical protein